MKAFGRLDILVNNAAEQHEVEEPAEARPRSSSSAPSAPTSSASSSWPRRALKHLKKGASIINTTSITAYRGHKTLLDYSVDQGRDRHLHALAVARRWSRSGIRVNARGAGADLDAADPGVLRRRRRSRSIGASAPMERAGQPNEVAPCYVFLASEDASYITGQVLHPNGGSVVNT